jgi:phage pi2 protein 07
MNKKTKIMDTSRLAGNAYTLVQEIKQLLVQMAMNDELPVDMNQLDTQKIQELIIRIQTDQEIPTEVGVGVYYYIDDNTNKPVFDFEEMTNEFNLALKELENKFGG